MTDLFQNNGATFSPCRRYRYLLWRTWDTTKARLAFLMLNPSTADENVNDPTIERCQRRAIRLSYGGIVIANLFAWRATDPDALRGAVDPVGPKNDAAIFDAAEACHLIVCGWGAHPISIGRAESVIHMLNVGGFGNRLRRLGRATKDGQPRHPLYVAYSEKLEAHP